MTKVYHLDIVSVEEKIFSGLVKKIQVISDEGEMGIFPFHSPLLAYLRPGLVHVLTNFDKVEYLYLSGGILEVQPTVVTILADTAIRSEDLDTNKALVAKKRAEECIGDLRDNLTQVQIIAEISKAIEKIKILERIKK